jgi:hypothetical protein
VEEFSVQLIYQKMETREPSKNGSILGDLQSTHEPTSPESLQIMKGFLVLMIVQAVAQAFQEGELLYLTAWPTRCTAYGEDICLLYSHKIANKRHHLFKICFQGHVPAIKNVYLCVG